jgi:predicted lipid-binding transport protein (Tim44 family)
MAAPTRLVALLAALPLALGACGQAAKDSAGGFQGEQKNVAQTVEDLQSFARKGDASKICSELLAPDLVAKIKASSHETCDKALKDTIADADAFELQVQKVTVNSDKATAVVRSQGGNKDRTDTLELVRDRGAWKIATLGTATS